MFHLTIYYSLFILIQTVVSDSTCIYDVENGLQLDIRTLGFANERGSKYNQIIDTNPTTNSFSWNGCFSYSKFDGGNCSNAAACYFDSIKNISILIAKQDTVQFTYNQGSSILSYETSHGYLTVFLICRDTDDDTTIAHQDDTNIYKFYIESRCCCPGMCHYSTHTISRFVIIIIIIVVFLLGYIIGGIIFLRYKPKESNRCMCLNFMSYMQNRYIVINDQEI
ncbi:unnamed protein product [Adineta steineri]|uniref:Uncharacterized protein n=1 Tax=Adineta steineri TaxID=433720 RepID=A0A815H4S7_9BILA|nr:unnamed protein product [Adineta steineri]CAF1347273.1 unnamed protein product [Adineta steineri]